MKRFVSLLGILAWIAVANSVAAPVPEPAKDPVKDELARLQGTWKVISYEKDGEKLDAETLAKLKLQVTFKGKDYSFANDLGSGTIDGIDPTKKPKTIDYKPAGGENEGRIEQGIYELDGDTFKDCFSSPGKDRPTKFSAECGSGQTLVKYERVREEK